MAKKIVEITDAEIGTLNFIERFSRKRGMPPTLREIADAEQIALSTAAYRVRRLAMKGRLKRSKAHRDLRIVQQPNG